MQSARGARRIATALSALLVVAASACAKNAPQDVVGGPFAGPVARDAAHLFVPVFWIAAAIFFIVEGLLIYTIVRFRARSDRDVPVQVHGNKVLEITWTLIPALILAGVAVPTVAQIFSVSSKPPAANALKVEVTARQWWWEYRYPDLGVVTANELHVPIGRPVALTLRSIDVIHSFWIPKVAGKEDVIPGRTNHMYFTADAPGTYLGECAEFCQISHANMRLRLIAQTPGEFDSWVSAQKQDAATANAGLAAQGAAIFAKNQCIFCHSIRGTKAIGKVGPDLTHIASRTTFAGATFDLTEANLLRWVSDAPSLKPGAKMPRGIKELGLTPEDVRAIVAYLMSLR